MTSLATNLDGYSVFGRKGFLGTVVGGDGGRSGGGPIVVRGGVSDSLLFHLPSTCVRAISPSRRTVMVDADVGDFVPRLGDDGTVELHIVS